MKGIHKRERFDARPSIIKYEGLYDMVVFKDYLLREINEIIDFSFVYDERKDKYCHDNGRNAFHPIRMFKYLLLKAIYTLSDVDLVERAQVDMSFKYFLEMAPEHSLIFGCRRHAHSRCDCDFHGKRTTNR